MCDRVHKSGGRVNCLNFANYLGEILRLRGGEFQNQESFGRRRHSAQDDNRVFTGRGNVLLT
jgi:hypothetical protein